MDQNSTLNNHCSLRVDNIFRLNALLIDATTGEKTSIASFFAISKEKKHPFLYVETGYWKGDRFVSPMGEYLYMSASESDSNLYQENRQIFFTKFRLKRHMSDNLKLELRANLYVDLKGYKKGFDNSDNVRPKKLLLKNQCKQIYLSWRDQLLNQK